VAQCPNCRVAIATSNPNYVVREIIGLLQVRCPNSTECNWRGKVDDIKGHRITCLYETIECDAEGCNHKCLRKDMADHLSDMNVKLQHMKLHYDKKLEEMETKHARSMEQMETKYQQKFTEYENKMQEYENRLQTMGGDDNKKRKRSSSAPDHFVVQGCGIDEINGAYSRDGESNNVPKYVRTDQYLGRAVVFSLYRFRCSQWCISIIRGPEPSSDDDIDFYINYSNDPLPPTDDWTLLSESFSNNHGVSPPPKVYPVSI